MSAILVITIDCVAKVCANKARVFDQRFPRLADRGAFDQRLNRSESAKLRKP